MSAIMGDDWDSKEKLISSKMAGKVMEAIYNQNGFVLESLTKQILIMSDCQRCFCEGSS